MFRKMAQAGAKIIYVPSFWSANGVSNSRIESRNLDALCHCRAFETESAIIYVNAAGRYAPGDDLIGRSQIAVPIRGALKRAEHNRESLLVLDLPLRILARAAKIYKIRDDIRKGYPK